jgi:hypothetical protein
MEAIISKPTSTSRDLGLVTISPSQILHFANMVYHCVLRTITETE